MADGIAGPGASSARKQKKTSNPVSDIRVKDHALRLATQWVEAMEAELDPQGREQVEEEEREAEHDWAGMRTYAAQRREQGQLHGPEIQGRPMRLGLGAKFLPHSKVAPGVAAIERRLKGKLKRAAEAGDEVPVGTKRPYDSKSSQTHKASQEEEDAEDEEESRASSFKKRSNVSIFKSSPWESKKGKKKGRPQ